MYHFVLGANDPEMQEIKNVLTQQGLPYSQATIRAPLYRRDAEAGDAPVRAATQSRLVRAFDAYRADSMNSYFDANAELVFVECAVHGLRGRIVDHHSEGDPGYGLGPERYLEGSSLGQVLALLELDATPEQRIIAAADHCLAHAYAGRCPGVDPTELGRWRVRSRAQQQGIEESELEARIREAEIALRSAPRVNLGGEPVAWFETAPVEVSEASGRTGIGFTYLRRERDGRMKAGIMGSAAPAIREWMDKCELNDVYGDPQRGYAGGYF